MRRQELGFTLIEVLIFIVVVGLLMSTLLMGGFVVGEKTPNVHRQMVAVQSARSCLEWYLNQKRLNGYSALTCPSTPSVAQCAVPAGYTVSVSVSCTTWNGDATYKTVTASVTGLASTSLSVMVGNS